jgi:hypothetical protein
MLIKGSIAMHKASILPFLIFKKKGEIFMGCEYFAVEEWGPSPQEAFKNAKKYYSLMYGHSLYEQ